MGVHLAIEPLTAHGTNGAGAKGRRLPNGAKSLTARNHQKRGITNDAGRELPDGGKPEGAVVVCAFRDFAPGAFCDFVLLVISRFL